MNNLSTLITSMILGGEIDSYTPTNEVWQFSTFQWRAAEMLRSARAGHRTLFISNNFVHISTSATGRVCEFIRFYYWSLI